ERVNRTPPGAVGEGDGCGVVSAAAGRDPPSSGSSTSASTAHTATMSRPTARNDGRGGRGCRPLPAPRARRAVMPDAGKVTVMCILLGRDSRPRGHLAHLAGTILREGAG